MADMPGVLDDHPQRDVAGLEVFCTVAEGGIEIDEAGQSLLGVRYFSMPRCPILRNTLRGSAMEVGIRVLSGLVELGKMTLRPQDATEPMVLNVRHVPNQSE
jgi:hypothetical protein